MHIASWTFTSYSDNCILHTSHCTSVYCTLHFTLHKRRLHTKDFTLNTSHPCLLKTSPFDGRQIGHWAGLPPNIQRRNSENKSQNPFKKLWPGFKKNFQIEPILLIICFNRVLTEWNIQFCIISPIGYLKSPIGYILSNWGLMIGSLTLRYQTHISPIPNWIYILPPFWNLRFPIGDSMPKWGYYM